MIIIISSLITLALVSLVDGILILIAYVANNTFPPPLPEEEEAKYIALLMKGDEHARNVLIERNLRLVAHIVKKFDNIGEDQDDLISIGTIGLIKAIGTFDYGKGTKLATYAAKCIENEILMHLRFKKKARVEMSLYEPIGVDKEGNEVTLIDILGTSPEIVQEMAESRFEKGRLMEKIKNLSKREIKVLELRFGLNNGEKKTQREIAKYLGISRSYVSRIEKKAIIKLTRELSSQGM